MTEPTVPLVDLGIQHREIASEIDRGFAQVFERTDFILGQPVADFEREFAAFCGVGHCVSVANGTDAIELCLRAALAEGSDVVLPANTYVATAEAVARAGHRPVLVDCDPAFQLIDPEAAVDALERGARAAIPVHLFGQLAPVEALESAAASREAVVIEDAAQCQGARRSGHGPGSRSLAATTSFYAGKNLGAYGDAGAVLSNDEHLATRLRRLRNHGGEARYEHTELGFNSRMDTLQAVVLLAKLRRLDAWNEQRREAACRYGRMLAGVEGVTPPQAMPGNLHVWHLYVVRVPRRDRVVERMKAEGIGVGIHYPTPVHLLAPFAYLGYRKGDFPVAEAAAREILSLPMFPGITESQQERVVDALTRALC